MTRPPSRRRFLAAAVPVALAGCLVEDESSAAGQTGGTTDGDGSGETAPAGDDESTAGAATDGSDDAEPTADAADDDDGDTSPGPAGIAVEETDIVRIVESNLLSQIVADVTVRNTGERAYGTLELRVDAYYEPPEDDRTYHPPRVDERTAVGRTYVEDDFESFGSGTRTFEDVVIQYDAEDANDSTDPAEFDVEIAVRRAEPP